MGDSMTPREKELLVRFIRHCLVFVLAGLLVISMCKASRADSLPLGIRHNNPGNMVSKQHWKYAGAIGHDDFGYLIFKHPWFGIRAMNRQLLRYHRGGFRTLRQIASFWTELTPGQELEQYIKVLSQNTGVKSNIRLNLRNCDLRMDLMQGIVVAENGIQPYPDTMYRDAMRH